MYQHLSCAAAGGRDLPNSRNWRGCYLESTPLRTKEVAGGPPPKPSSAACGCRSRRKAVLQSVSKEAGRVSGWRGGGTGQWLTRGASGWRVGPVVGGSDQWLATGGLFHVPCSPLDFERGWWTEKKTQKDLSRKKNYRVRVSKPAPEHGTWNTGRRAPRPHTRVQGRGAASRCIAGSACRVQHALS
jgi:hypothetical protein